MANHEQVPGISCDIDLLRRAFNYDVNTAKLTSATTPEGGTVQYTFLGDGRISTRTDPDNVKTMYSYDGYKRLTSVTRYDSAGKLLPCESVTYYHDTNPWYGGSGQWGRLTGAEWNVCDPSLSSSPAAFKESYSYTTGGLMTSRNLSISIGEGSPWVFGASGAYDNEGRLTGYWMDGGQWSSRTFPGPGKNTYAFDTMGRPTKLTFTLPDGTARDVVTDVQYGAADELLQSKVLLPSRDPVTETRTYNERLQLTRISSTAVYAGRVLDVEYRYSPTQNDGRITQMKDWISGEEVTYQYDSLQRLISAVTTGPEWGQRFQYDGFGNLGGITAVKGTPLNMSVGVNRASNQLVGFGYDGRGNLTSIPGAQTFSYDAECTGATPPTTPVFSMFISMAWTANCWARGTSAYSTARRHLIITATSGIASSEAALAARATRRKRSARTIQAPMSQARRITPTAKPGSRPGTPGKEGWDIFLPRMKYSGLDLQIFGWEPGDFRSRLAGLLQ